MGEQVERRDELSKNQTFDESRARAVWRFFYLLVAGWIQFAFYFQFRGYHGAVYVSAAVLATFSIFYLFSRKADTARRGTAGWVINTYIAIHCIGVFFNALFFPPLVSVLLAIPIAMTIVYMLLGVSAAFKWLGVSIVAFVVYPILAHALSASPAPLTIIDDTTIKAGTCVVLFLCLREFESYFNRRASELLVLSEELEAKTQELNVLATTDTLTGLPNRFYFNSKMDEQLREAIAENKTVALLMLDMDGFKQVNDTLGHAVGDEALSVIASRIQLQLGKDMLTARLGGDEFCILIRNSDGSGDIEQFCQNLHHSLCQPYCLSNVTCQLGVSIGIAYCPIDAKTPENLLAFADTAMFYAKDNKLPFAFYKPQQTERVIDYCAMQEKLRNALQRDEFYLVYQPLIDVATGSIVGAEALLRWRHEGNTISPAHFIPHLESTHQIVEVTEWVLGTVCAQINQWNEIGFSIKIAVNISAIDFHDNRFIDTVMRTVGDSNINADQLELEITEGVFIDNLDEVANKFHSLQQLGITVSIDDFGTGYSSLAYIQKLPINKLKIDREFIKNIPEKDNGIIASTVIYLAKRLGLKVLAEGVETEAQLQFLKDNSCHQYQGFLSSKPILAAEFLQYALDNGNKFAPQYNEAG